MKEEDGWMLLKLSPYPELRNALVHYILRWIRVLLLDRVNFVFARVTVFFHAVSPVTKNAQPTGQGKWLMKPG